MVIPLLTSPLGSPPVCCWKTICRNLRIVDTPARDCRKNQIVVFVHGVRVCPFPPTVPSQGPNPKSQKISNKIKG